MVTKGLLIRLEATPEHAADVERFLEDVMPLIEGEPGTAAMLAVRLGPASYGIVNAFPGEAARQAHVGGDAAVRLSALAASTLASPPAIEPFDIVAAKLPGGA
jgi:quinol monooxygenase YgiN